MALRDAQGALDRMNYALAEKTAQLEELQVTRTATPHGLLLAALAC
jgi:hypothetical protein